MLALQRSHRALLCSPKVALGRRFNATLSDSQKGKAPPPSTSEDPHFTGPPESSEESFGKGFYISIAAVVGTFALYKLEQSISGSDRSPFTRMIEHYGDLQDTWEKRNARRTELIERAGTDRSLFQDSKTSGTINIRFPEALNAYSPRNHEVGWVQSVDLTAVKNHYESQRRRD